MGELAIRETDATLLKKEQLYWAGTFVVGVTTIIVAVLIQHANLPIATLVTCIPLVFLMVYVEVKALNIEKARARLKKFPQLPPYAIRRNVIGSQVELQLIENNSHEPVVIASRSFGPDQLVEALEYQAELEMKMDTLEEELVETKRQEAAAHELVEALEMASQPGKK